MGIAQETIVQKCLALFHSTGMPDTGQIAQLFAEEAVYQPLVPRGTPKRGRAAIVAELERQFGRYSECHCELLAMASTDRHVFTERRDHVCMRDGRRVFSSVNAVFEFDDQQRIVSWREYWDAADVAQLLGTTAEAIHTRMSESAP
jgi:limonene-1,2-epoxide hydrolase